MSQQPPAHPALLHPPFFIIPGISPTSPISAQTEQIDQLNTLLLQEIDANFARFHQIVTTRILPEIKRFAIAGEPTKEAARFWRSFFEAAAAVRVPVPGVDNSTLNATSTEEGEGEDGATEYDDQTMRLRRGEDESSYLDSRVEEEGSFMFQNGVTSSTPLPGRTGTVGGAGPDDSWENSMGSPFDQVDRRLMTDLKIGTGYADSDAPTPSLPSGYELPGLNQSDYTSSVLDEGVSTGTVERDNLDPSADTPKASKTQSRVNPFNQSNHPSISNSSSHWNGIADLRSTPLNAKFKKPKSTKPISTTLPDLSDDDDDLKLNMSPPVTMNFTLPSRAQAMIKVAGKTPVKGGIGGTKSTSAVEARLVIDDLMEEMERGYEPSPRMPTPEGLGRYSILPGEMGSGRLLFNSAAAGSTSAPTGSGHRGSPLPRKSLANTSFGSDMSPTIHLSNNQQQEFADADDSFDEDSFDSIDQGQDPQNAAQLGDETYLSMSPDAPHRSNPHQDQHNPDIGDVSNISSLSSSSDNDLDVGQTSEAGFIFGGPKNAAKGGFSLLRPDEMVTFHGGKLEDAGGAESPTPWGGR